MNLRDMVIKDFWWKLASFLLAVFIWSVVKVTIQRELRMTDDTVVPAIIGGFKKVPVTLLRDPTDLRPLRVAPSEVEVIISGDQSLLKNVNARQVEAFVNLTEVRRLEGTPVKISVTLPSGIALIRVEPPTALVTVRDLEDDF
ncbi:MAG: hypothetical protein H7X97_08065 [Opitutaceae bacterium]|nr:hypothetical protein [Verrucomicrobiales bacterium]